MIVIYLWVVEKDYVNFLSYIINEFESCGVNLGCLVYFKGRLI